MPEWGHSKETDFWNEAKCYIFGGTAKMWAWSITGQSRTCFISLHTRAVWLLRKISAHASKARVQLEATGRQEAPKSPRGKKEIRSKSLSKQGQIFTAGIRGGHSKRFTSERVFPPCCQADDHRWAWCQRRGSAGVNPMLLIRTCEACQCEPPGLTMLTKRVRPCKKSLTL